MHVKRNKVIEVTPTWAKTLTSWRVQTRSESFLRYWGSAPQATKSITWRMSSSLGRFMGHEGTCCITPSQWCYPWFSLCSYTCPIQSQRSTMATEIARTKSGQKVQVDNSGTKHTKFGTCFGRTFRTPNLRRSGPKSHENARALKPNKKTILTRDRPNVMHNFWGYAIELREELAPPSHTYSQTHHV